MAGIWSKPGTQETEWAHLICTQEAVRSHLICTQDEREPKVRPRCETSNLGTSDTTSSKDVPPKGSTVFPNNTANWRQSVQLHEPMGHFSFKPHFSFDFILVFAMTKLNLGTHASQAFYHHFWTKIAKIYIGWKINVFSKLYWGYCMSTCKRKKLEPYP